MVDAYCPHLGANLAAGGRVLGDCIECPFHGWQFQGSDGKCVRIPYAEKGERHTRTLQIKVRVATVSCSGILPGMDAKTFLARSSCLRVNTI